MVQCYYLHHLSHMLSLKRKITFESKLPQEMRN